MEKNSACIEGIVDKLINKLKTTKRGETSPVWTAIDELKEEGDIKRFYLGYVNYLKTCDAKLPKKEKERRLSKNYYSLLARSNLVVALGHMDPPTNEIWHKVMGKLDYRGKEYHTFCQISQGKF